MINMIIDLVGDLYMSREVSLATWVCICGNETKKLKKGLRKV